LNLEKCGLSDIAALGTLNNLTTLNIANNDISDISALAGLGSLKSVTCYGNLISDYTPLKGVETVNIWNGSEIFTTTKDPYAPQVKVIVDNLRIRSTPSSENDDNYDGEHAEENGYYYILDSYEDGEGRLWYKIGNDQWFCSNEGEWTELYE